jgi:Sulfotransferase family
MALQLDAPKGRPDAFRVAKWIDRFGAFISRHRDLCIRLGELESKFLSDQIGNLKIDRPVYIAGLARSGSTILLEVVASSPGIATHQYRDYPPIFTPYAWNWWLRHVPLGKPEPAERTHADGIMVTDQSPEAMEEVLWMAFFDHLHDSGQSNILDGSVTNPRFEKFYRDHIAKLILVRGARRYASKENYNITRLEYLQRLFPDAKFVIPIRHPASHIASLIKQHRLFGAGQRESPEALAHLQRVGHFEFGLDLRPINTGAGSSAAEVAALWARGEEVRGWARYWAAIYEFVARRLDENPALRKATLVVRFEDLCATPAEMLARLREHCALDDRDLIERWAERLHAPAYYRAKFSDEDLRIISEEAGAAARCFGYDPLDPSRCSATAPARIDQASLA